MISVSSCQTPQTPLPRAQHRGEPQIYERGRTHSKRRCTGAARDTQFTELDSRAWAPLQRWESGAEGAHLANTRGVILCLESVHEYPFSLGLPFTSPFPPPLLSFPLSFSLLVFQPFSYTSLPHHFLFQFILLPFSQFPLLPVSSLLTSFPLFSSPELSSSYLPSPLTPSPSITPFSTRLPSPLSPVLPVPSCLHPPPLASPTFFPSFLFRPAPQCPPGPAPNHRPRPAGGHGVDGRAAAVAAPPVTWSRDALQHGGAVGPRRRFLTGRRGRTRPVVAGTPGPQPLSPACSRRPPAGLPAPAGPGPCRRARPRACSCPGPWRRS